MAVDGPDAATAASLVPAGYGAAAAASGKVGTEALLPAPVISDAGKIWRARSLDFALVPVPTAQGYHLQLAKDAAFQDMVAEARSATTTLRVTGIDNGNYYVRAMAIAPSGLEGLSETYPITRTLAPLRGWVTSVGNDRHRFEWDSEGKGTPLFRFQIYAEANPETPIIDETGLTTYSIIVDGLSPARYMWRVGMKRFTGGAPDEFWTDPEVLTIPVKGR